MQPRIIRDFSEMCGTLNRGMFAQKLNEQLTAALEELGALPSEHGKATLTLTIILKRDGDRIDVAPSIKTKLPEGKAFSDTVFFAYDDGLSVQHPSQIDMFSGPRSIDTRDVSITSAKT